MEEDTTAQHIGECFRCGAHAPLTPHAPWGYEGRVCWPCERELYWGWTRVEEGRGPRQDQL
jgi:hypothetical protein